MGRIADVLFNGIVSGAANGMHDYIVSPSNSEKKVTSVANEHLVNAAKERPPVKTWPDGQDRHIVGSRKPGSPSSSVETPTQIPSPIRSMGNTENSLEQNVDVPAEIKTEETPHDDLISPQQDPHQSIVREESCSKEGNSQVPTIQSDPVSYSRERIQNDLKAIFREARKEAKLDGLSEEKKVHLNDIITFTANRLTYPKGIAESEKKYKHVADLTLKKLEDYIRSIAPEVDAKFVAHSVVLRTCDAKHSSACVEKAAKATQEVIHRERNKKNETPPVGSEQSAVSQLGTKPFSMRQVEHLNSNGKKTNSLKNCSVSGKAKSPNSEYLLGLTQILVGGALVLCAGPVVLCSVGGVLTIGCVISGATGVGFIGDGLVRTIRNSQNVSLNKYPDYPSVNSGRYDKDSFSTTEMTKKKTIDPTLPADPDNLLKKPDWKETTHPDAGKKGHRTFENTKTGERLRHDKGKPGETGHKAQDHYHRQVPNQTGGYNYVDGNGNPVPPGSEQSHLYPNTVK